MRKNVELERAYFTHPSVPSGEKRANALEFSR